MDLGLKERVAIVTGGSGGNIGSAICRTFAQEGANVVVVARREAVAQKVAEECQALGVKSMAFKVDVTKPEDTELMAKKVLNTYGRIDILVNTAGYGLRASIIDMTEEQWDALMGVHLKGHFACTKAAASRMVQQKSGRIINFSSRAAFGGHANGSAYATAKAGVMGFTLSMADE